MDENHRLNDMGNGCTCGKYGCKKWKDWFPEKGTEKRCPRCWSLAVLYETDWGKITSWCSNCEMPINNAPVIQSAE